MIVTCERLTAACSDTGTAAGIAIAARLEPLAGPGAPVKPSVYEGAQYQRDRRWFGGGADRKQEDVIVIDNVPSQANRLEAALQTNRRTLGLPEIVLDLSELRLPPHLPREISSFQFPHRNADAYLRDADLDGTAFPRTQQGAALFAASDRDPDALYHLMPAALIYGFWQAHLGKKRQQTKLARAWVSEIIGVAPAATDTRVLGVKGDPLNLTISDGVSFDEQDLLADWGMTTAARKGNKSRDSLGEIGHGQVLVAGTPAAVSFREIWQQSSLSFGALRRIQASTPEASAAGRALLAAIGLAAHVLAFGPPSFAVPLRSGCDLRPRETSWRWLGDMEDEPIEPPTRDDVIELVRETSAAAAAAGLPVGERWPDQLRLAPRANLRSAIEKSWPLNDGF